MNLFLALALALDNLCSVVLNDWEVLMGQNEVVNYLKSSPTKLKTMRFAGEFKLAGGNVDPGETITECAKRELYEEFLRPLTKLGQQKGAKAADKFNEGDIFLHPFSVKQTRPIRSRASVLHNFVCLADENPFLATLDVEAVNHQLSIQRKSFRESVLDESYWSLSAEEKETVSPEVHQLQWMSLADAVKYSISAFFPQHYVNKWQKEQFDFLSRTNAENKVKKRDPMLITAASLIGIECFDSVQQLLAYCKRVTLKELREEEQWLFEGMTNEEVVKATKHTLETPSRVLLDAEDLKSARKEQNPRFQRVVPSKL